MKGRLYLAATFIAALTHTPAYAQERGAEKTSVVEQRASKAKITDNKPGNGAAAAEAEVEGGLEPNAQLGCISISQVTANYNPPALIYAAKKCILQGDYLKAWPLLRIGYSFAQYDLQRMADRSSQSAGTALSINAFADLTYEQCDKAQEVSNAMQRNSEQVAAFCKELKRMGPPTYEPQWAILHVSTTKQEPQKGQHAANPDTKAIWEKILTDRCTPQEP